MDESASSHVSSLSTERARAAIPTTDAGASQLLLDPDAASELIRSAYLPVRVLPQRTGTEFRMRMTNLQVGTMTAGVIAVASSTRIVAVETTQFHLDLTLRGRVATVRSGAQPVVTERGAGALFNPEQAYLREVRLRRAHQTLLEAHPGTIQVQDVAVRFGFLHLGRFSATYRRRYGENPSATLARLPS